MRKIILGVSILLTTFLASCDSVEDAVDDISNTDKVKAVVPEYGTSVAEFQEANMIISAGLIKAQISTTPDTRKTLKSSEQEEIINAQITIEPADFTTFPKTITIDFGDEWVVYKGINYKGKIIVETNNWFESDNLEYTATFEDYYQGTRELDGSYKLESIESENQNPRTKITVENGEITDDEGTIIYNCENIREQISGSETLGLSDDSYLINVDEYGTNTDGYSYAYKTGSNEDITVSYDCKYIRAGSIDVEIEGADLTLDFGDISDNCEDDSKVTVEIVEGVPISISMY